MTTLSYLLPRSTGAVLAGSLAASKWHVPQCGPGSPAAPWDEGLVLSGHWGALSLVLCP